VFKNEKNNVALRISSAHSPASLGAGFKETGWIGVPYAISASHNNFSHRATIEVIKLSGVHRAPFAMGNRSTPWPSATRATTCSDGYIGYCLVNKSCGIRRPFRRNVVGNHDGARPGIGHFSAGAVFVNVYALTLRYLRARGRTSGVALGIRPVGNRQQTYPSGETANAPRHNDKSV
jgi:hypothetical protein